MASAARSAARGRVALPLLCALFLLLCGGVAGVHTGTEPQGSAPLDCPPGHTSSAFVDSKVEWTLGDGGQDCNAACDATGGVCVESVWEAVADAAGFAVHAARLGVEPSEVLYVATARMWTAQGRRPPGCPA